MKIGIMGTHGTGKTTFAAELADTLGKNETVRLVTGVARSCPAPINREATEWAQRWIYHRHMLLELEAEAEAEIVVCDRTAIDSLVYADVAGFEALVDAYLPAALGWMETYDQIYWFRPMDGRLVADGKRDVSPEYQARVDKVFNNWIDCYRIDVSEVNRK
jgi:deoxyadenosine/deoxycytidine kinase